MAFQQRRQAIVNRAYGLDRSASTFSSTSVGELIT